jgi:hypothetical protein
MSPLGQPALFFVEAVAYRAQGGKGAEAERSSGGCAVSAQCHVEIVSVAGDRAERRPDWGRVTNSCGQAQTGPREPSFDDARSQAGRAASDSM